MSDTGYPTKPSEGTLVVDNTNLGAYVSEPFTVSGLTKGKKYYFSAFPYSVQGVYNLSSNAANRADATPAAGEIANVTIDIDDDSAFSSVVVTCVDETESASTQSATLTKTKKTASFVVPIGHTYHIKKLVWSTDKNKRMNHLDGCNMTVHRDYANKSCPGDYLYNRHGEIAAEVNRRLGAAVDTPTVDKPTSSSVKAGDTVKISSTATYYGGKAIPAWVKAKNWIVREVSGDRAIIDKSVDGKNAICSPISTKYLSVVSAASTPSQSAWTPQVGDYVSFTGKTHYASSNSDRAVSCKGGKAKITQIYTKGKHPYHLVHADGGSTVYGWVDRDSFTKA